MKKLHLLLLFIFLACTLRKEENYFPEYLSSNIEDWRNAGSNISASDFDLVYRGVPGENIQALIDSVANIGGGKVVLSSGTYLLNKPLVIPGGIFIQGENRENVRLVSNFKYPFEPSPFKTPCSIEFSEVENSGVSNLTLRYEAVDFPPYVPANFHDLWDEEVFQNDPEGDTLLYVGHIGIKNSKNISIDRCTILNSGTDPVVIAGSKYVTVSNSLIKGSYNKGGKGNGYFNIDKGSNYVLVNNNQIEKIRHVAIQMDTHHNVLIDNYLEVDVNFHNGDAGYNLIEGNTIRIPEWHGWHCFSAGAESLHQPPGPQNYLFNNFTQYKFYIPSLRPMITEHGDSIIYKSMTIIDTVWVNEKPLIRYEYGEIKESQSTNRLYLMNDKWDSRKRVLLCDTLTFNKIW